MHINILIEILPPPHSFNSIYFKPIQLLDPNIIKTPWLFSLGANVLHRLWDKKLANW